MAFSVLTSQGPVGTSVGKLSSLLRCHEEAEDQLRAARGNSDRLRLTYLRATRSLPGARPDTGGGESWIGKPDPGWTKPQTSTGASVSGLGYPRSPSSWPGSRSPDALVTRPRWTIRAGVLTAPQGGGAL
jgi:hypothetical protein